MTATPVALGSRPDGVPPGTAGADLLGTDVAALRARVDSATAADVERSLGRPRRGPDDLAVLLSAPAAERLEDLAAAAHRLTVQRFGRAVRLFAPLYVGPTRGGRWWPAASATSCSWPASTPAS